MEPHEREALEGRVAVVTGGGRGLGRAMALGLARAGCRVVPITSSREAREIAAVAAAGGGADQILALTADVTREEDCARVVEATLSRFGRLDILVNNAGRGMKYVSERFLTDPTRFWEVRPDVFRMVIDFQRGSSSVPRRARRAGA